MFAGDRLRGNLPSLKKERDPKLLALSTPIYYVTGHIHVIPDMIGGNMISRQIIVYSSLLQDILPTISSSVPKQGI